MTINPSGAIAAAATVAIMHSNRGDLTPTPSTLLQMISSILFTCILLVFVGLTIYSDVEFKKIEDNKKNEK